MHNENQSLDYLGGSGWFCAADRNISALDQKAFAELQNRVKNADVNRPFTLNERFQAEKASIQFGLDGLLCYFPIQLSLLENDPEECGQDIVCLLALILHAQQKFADCEDLRRFEERCLALCGSEKMYMQKAAERLSKNLPISEASQPKIS